MYKKVLFWHTNSMKVIVNTEEILNEYSDLIKVVYHYVDVSKSENKVFVPVTKAASE